MKELIIDKQTINLYPRLTTKKTSSGIVFIYNSNELLKISRKYTCLLGLEKEEDIPDYTILHAVMQGKSRKIAESVDKDGCKA